MDTFNQQQLLKGSQPLRRRYYLRWLILLVLGAVSVLLVHSARADVADDVKKTYAQEISNPFAPGNATTTT